MLELTDNYNFTSSNVFIDTQFFNDAIDEYRKEMFFIKDKYVILQKNSTLSKKEFLKGFEDARAWKKGRLSYKNLFKEKLFLIKKYKH